MVIEPFEYLCLILKVVSIALPTSHIVPPTVTHRSLHYLARLPFQSEL